MVTPDPDTDQLVGLAAAGDVSAVDSLLARHRRRLRQMVAARMDPRLAPRVDPSDVVQETLAQAAQQLPEYCRTRPLPFYPWLRQLAWQRLMQHHRRHLKARSRSRAREAPLDLTLSDDSALRVADRFLVAGSSPSENLSHEERQACVRQALTRLSASDRELLLMRYLEQLTNHEIAAILGTSEPNVRMRQFRAVVRLRKLLGDDFAE